MAATGDIIGIDPRGDNFVVYVTTDDVRHELEITENDVLYFSRLFPSLLRHILARRNLAAGVSAAAAVPTTECHVNDDLHQTEVILRIRDEAGGDFEWSLPADQARRLGNSLIARAETIDRSLKAPPH